MRLQIHSVKRTLFDGEVKSVNCNTALGEITILDNHRPLITVMERGTVTIIDNAGVAHYVNVSSGFAEVQKNHASMIVEEAL